MHRKEKCLSYQFKHPSSALPVPEAGLKCILFGADMFGPCGLSIARFVLLVCVSVSWDAPFLLQWVMRLLVTADIK